LDRGLSLVRISVETMPHPIVTDELELLRRVIESLDRAPQPRGPSEESVVKDISYLQSVLAEGTEEKDRPALIQQLDRQSALLEQLRRSRSALRVDRDSPYFGHLQLREDGTPWDLCLGKATRIAGDVRVVDWRHAPISKIFYRYQQGDVYDEEIAGRLRTGTVGVRRTVTIRAARLERVDAPEGSFHADPETPDGWRRVDIESPRLAGGEGTALRAYACGEGGHRRLGTDLHGVRHRADKRLPDIAGLIDPEQFRLITKPSAGLVVVRGTAGSGKTTIALHRIAYLAYENPEIDSGGSLVVVFSPALRNYVSHVLPALGVEHVRVCTFRTWAGELRHRLFPMLPRATREDTPAVVQRLKLHHAMLVAMERQVREIAGPHKARQVVDDWGSVLSRYELLKEVSDEVAPGAFSEDELRRATDWCRRRHEELLAWLNGDREIEAELDNEDDALLLRAWQLRIGPLSRRLQRALRYRHIAVDEVQDFSPLEIRVLFDCLDEHRSMTLAGDTRQHVMQQAGFTSWDDFFFHLGIPGTAVDTLRISYRSSRQIMAFATAVLGDLREDEEPPLTTREGPAVELLRFTDHGACVAFLADALKDLAHKEPLASIAVLSPSRTLSDEYHRGLRNSDVPRLRLVENQEFTFAPGVEVTEIEQVKGLEFDYVVMVEVSSTNFPDTPAARRRLHVGATRAIHQLWLTSVATPSPLLGVMSHGS
jgi:DNA helicase II / ATP-dependent DNA helicase PcrA